MQDPQHKVEGISYAILGMERIARQSAPKKATEAMVSIDLEAQLPGRKSSSGTPKEFRAHDTRLYWPTVKTPSMARAVEYSSTASPRSHRARRSFFEQIVAGLQQRRLVLDPAGRPSALSSAARCRTWANAALIFREHNSAKGNQRQVGSGPAMARGDAVHRDTNPVARSVDGRPLTFETSALKGPPRRPALALRDLRRGPARP